MLLPCISRPASGERYLVCTELLPPPPSPPGCRFTNALQAKVHTLQEAGRQRRQIFDPNPAPATVSKDVWVGHASSSVAPAGCGGGGGEVYVSLRHGARGVGGGNKDAVAEEWFDAGLGVEAEMKQDESFMSYLRCTELVLGWFVLLIFACDTRAQVLHVCRKCCLRSETPLLSP